ncbi:MAG TPA: TIGR03013 family XrtA/PEP-CTERM system glycosyltransferase [Vicinamibacterales bacterium]|nr:TIGR03013 family XrtA/PEP-CTERM system glycosyltransferase [Vicinamibacterales bacterium]
MSLTNWRPTVLILGETCLLLGAVFLGIYVRLGAEAWRLLQAEGGWPKVFLIVAVCQVTLHYSDLYDLRGVTGFHDLTVRLMSALGTTSLILAVLYYLAPNWIIGRGVFLISVAFMITFVVAWRAAFAWLTRRVSPRERLLLVGTSTAAVDLARELFARRQELGVDIVGFVDPDRSRIGAPVINPGVVGAIDDIPQLVSRLNVDRVVVSLSDARGKLPMDQLLDIRFSNGVTFDHLASVYEEYTGKIAVENLRPSWLIFSEGFRKTRLLMAAKRALDVVFATIGLVIGAPVMLIVGALVKCTSRGPMLYHQTRVGLRGHEFTVHKFRTMCEDAERTTGPVWSTANDSRVTPVGRFLRRTRLDEMPQLWNVLVGEMSFVGPRPERPEFVRELTERIPYYGQRHVLKPGVTGWAQIRYTYGASVEDAIEKLQYDLYYIKNLSIALDVVIVLETLKTVNMRRGAR